MDLIKKNMKNNNRGISTVVVLALLLLMSFGIFLILSDFFEVSLNELKITQELSNNEQKIEIISIDGQNLKLVNNYIKNLEIISITINNVECPNLPTIIGLDTQTVNIGTCTTDLSLETIYPVIIEIDNLVIIENEILHSLS